VKCKAITAKGTQCKHDATFGDYCTVHYKLTFEDEKEEKKKWKKQA